MSTFAQFMKENKKKKENTTYAATRSIVDKNGEPVLWTLRPVSSRENAEIREDCMEEVQVLGKPNAYRQKMNTAKYISKILVA